MVGLFTVALVGVGVIVQLWDILDVRRGHSIRYFAKHFFARALLLIILPTLVYMSFFWLHFKILNQSGTGDAFMSPLFQMQLLDSPLTQNSLRKNNFLSYNY